MSKLNITLEINAEEMLRNYDIAIEFNLSIGVILTTPQQDTLRIEDGQFKCSNYNRIINALLDDVTSKDVFASYLAKGLLQRISE